MQGVHVSLAMIVVGGQVTEQVSAAIPMAGIKVEFGALAQRQKCDDHLNLGTTGGLRHFYKDLRGGVVDGQEGHELVWDTDLVEISRHSRR